MCGKCKHCFMFILSLVSCVCRLCERSCSPAAGISYVYVVCLANKGIRCEN